MSYIALYRKYRPRDFDEIVGQDAIVTTLKNQIKSEKVGHAYLFCGMRGTGKTSTARVFAKALNCEKGPTVNPCNECASCRAINGGSMVDVIEMDAASNRGIDDIRDLREKVNFPPSEGRYKVYIIDEVHMLTTEAFNALLKTLEEPPRHVVFILATTEPNKLPPTILSRCMRFDFRRVSTRELVKRMKEVAADVGVEAEDMALAQLARSSQGSVRDALSLLDRAVAFGGNKLLYGDVLDLLGAVNREVLYEVSDAVLQKDGGRMLGIVDDMATRGKDLFRFVDDLMEHYRNILLVAIGADRQLIDVVDEEYPELQKLAGNYSQEKLLSIIDILKDASNDMKWSSQPRIVLEAAMVKLALPELWENSQGYISRIQDLEQQMASLREQVQRVMEAAAHASSGTNGADTDKAAGMTDNDKAVNDANIDVAAGEARLQKSDSADAPSAAATRDTDEERLQQLIQSWPEIIEELGGIRKTLQTFIKEGRVRPCRIEKDNVFLFCPQEYKEIILLGKQIIEDVVRKITGMEIYVKGLESQPVDDEKKNF